jgi:hypothetical protein
MIGGGLNRGPVCVKARPTSAVFVALCAFQACSFNHSDISPCL